MTKFVVIPMTEDEYDTYVSLTGMIRVRMADMTVGDGDKDFLTTYALDKDPFELYKMFHSDDSEDGLVKRMELLENDNFHWRTDFFGRLEEMELKMAALKEVFSNDA